MRDDAVAFLKGLYAPAPAFPRDDLPPERRVLYRERVAVRKLSGGLLRELAEQYALLDTVQLMREWDTYANF